MSAYERDLTTGSVLKQLIIFAIPVFFANLLQACYSVVDMAIIGKFAGTDAIAAVSIGGMVINLISSFCVGFCIGGQIVVAQFYGASEKENVRKAFGALLVICLILSAALPAIGLPLNSRILAIMNTPAESLSAARSYVVICLSCMVFTLGFHGISSALRGVGDSRNPMIFMVISTGLNVVLDLLFVAVLKKGVAGAALATVIAQGISFAAALIYLIRQKDLFAFRRENFTAEARLYGLIFRVGIPIAVQQTVINIGAMFASSIINGYGKIYASGSGVGMKFENFAFLPHIAVSSAISTVVGQNMGAGKPERAAAATRYGWLINVLFGAATILVVQLFAPQIVGIFTNDPEVIQAGIEFLRITCFSYVLGGTAVALNGLSTGVGDAWFTLLTVLSTHGILRILACSILHFVLHLPLFWIYISYTVTPCLSILLSLIYIARGNWKNRSLVNP